MAPHDTSTTEFYEKSRGLLHFRRSPRDHSADLCVEMV